jgi:hypothetical protein
MTNKRFPSTIQPRLLWFALAAIVLVLFPFDWLGQVWPAYGQVFDQVFATAISHEIGHATLFFIAALLILSSFPALRSRPLRYFVVMVLGALGEEALQSLFKLQLPTIWDGRDLLLDLVGIVTAYFAIRLWQWSQLFKGKKR